MEISTEKTLETQISKEVNVNFVALQRSGIKYPEGFVPENAVKAAMFELSRLKLVEKAATNLTTYNSVINSVNMMMIQGLDAGKKQGYFIPYGDEVQFQRSYFGTVTMLKRLPEIKDIKAFEYYEDNVPEFEWDIQTMSLSKMKSWNPNHKSSELAGAFAVIYKNDGSFELTNMNIEEIHTSWSQSQNYGQTVWLNSAEEIKAAKAAGHKVKEGGKNGKTWAKYQTDEPNDVQSKHGGEMAKRTVINRAAKLYVNSSNAPTELVHAYNQTTENEYKEPKEAEHVKDVTPPRDYESEIMELKTLDELSIFWQHTVPDDNKEELLEAYQAKKDELFQEHMAKQQSQENVEEKEGHHEQANLFENN